ncbi:helix-turn-helix transcriptional regulator [Desulfovibrio sp.]|uniref:helix-turn-helix transcriptional regulator n=1 Tax=Desulfovibrio sp. TaxID=885 RepID=UPI0025B7BB73|nr:helix-turn-helix transcriptional regulator [Desulfovibrio sp.]
MRLQYHTRNIQRIEDGSRQPGVLLALRMVVAVDGAPGDFFETLFEEAACEACEGASSPTTRVSVTYQPLGAGEGLKSIFGPLLAQARLAVGMSQTAMAKSAGYNLRNVNAVEKGLQEPGVMSALALVAATGVDIREFFDQLHHASAALSKE